jgi:hypothetical protein
MPNIVFIAFALLIFFMPAVSIEIDGSLLSNLEFMLVTESVKQHTVDISNFENGKVISVVFSFSNNNIFSATFLMASLTEYYSSD